MQSIKKNALLNILYTASNILFPLVTFPYVSRVLQVELLGRVNFYSSFSSYAIMLASLGISTYGIRTVAQNRNDSSKLTKVTQELFLINFVAMIVVVVFITLLSLFIDRIDFDGQLLFINYILIFASPFGMNWLYSGLEQYSYITARTIIIKLISLILVFILVRKSDDYIIYAVIVAFSTVSAYICNFIHAGKFVSFRPVKLNMRQHFRSMLILFVSILAINIYTQLDTVMLGFICGDEQVGLYSIATYVKTALLHVINAVSAVLLPRISYYYGKKKITEINSILKRSISIIFMVALPTTVFFILEAVDSVMILGGESYMGAVQCMRTIMPILLVSGLSNIMGNQILIPLGKEKKFMKAVICGAVVNLLLNGVLMPPYGCYGAALATLCAEIIQMSIQCRYAKEYLIGNINFFSILKISVSVCVSSIGAMGISHKMIGVLPIVRIIIVCFAFFLIYFAGLLIFREKEFSLFFQQIVYKLQKRR